MDPNQVDGPYQQVPVQQSMDPYTDATTWSGRS